MLLLPGPPCSSHSFMMVKLCHAVLCASSLCFCWIKPFWPIDAIAGLWDVGEGVTGVLGELDVARMKPKP